MLVLAIAPQVRVLDLQLESAFKLHLVLALRLALGGIISNQQAHLLHRGCDCGEDLNRVGVHNVTQRLLPP